MQTDPAFGGQLRDTDEAGEEDSWSASQASGSRSESSLQPDVDVEPDASMGSEGASGTSWTLESLEADIAAVGSAMETVDRIVAGVASGEGSVGSAAAEITAVVSQERFGTPGTPAG